MHIDALSFEAPNKEMMEYFGKNITSNIADQLSEIFEKYGLASVL